MTNLFYTIFNVLALSVIIYTGVDIFYMTVSSRLRQVKTGEIALQQTRDVERHKRAPLSDFNAIMERNIFGTLDEASEGAEAAIELEALEPTSLNVALLGTVAGGEENAFAVIMDKGKKKQALYKVGDSLQNAIVKMILREKVILRVGDSDEILTMEESVSLRSETKDSGPEEPSAAASTITVSRSEMQGSMENLNELMTQIRIRPHFKNGDPDGVSVSNIKGGSIFSKLGLMNGDVIQGIDGTPLTGPDDLVELHEKMKSASELSIQLTRRNSPKTINYKFR